MNKVVVICGPTGVGKSAFGLAIAQRFQGEIISGDSMQVYRMMNIGTAKPTPAEMNLVPHHLIDICNLDEVFSVAEFQSLVRQKVVEITSRGHLPIIVGGTGLYLKAALYDYVFPEQVSDNETYANLDNTEIYAKLQEMDPLAAASIHINNRKRLIRALTILEATKQQKSEIIAKQSHQPLYDLLCIGLTSDREYIYNRINHRVESMFDQGLEEEVRSVLQYPNISLTAKQAIGYKEFIPYFNGEISLDIVKERIKQASRRYAKRQYTWFNNQMEVVWHDTRKDDRASIMREIEVFIHDKI